ncbi:hypothetical protein B0H17DRAFT_1029666 [Mycena rosella]|uniref:C3H1-type domain-containing protein n=1 Tax=Mycena rosella TaxID=1033263 RepID=A0AAD7MCB7_MYCRO|nr:hypothetical protein B0H17DRAFT_1029666 [Mycena rosella]
MLKKFKVRCYHYNSEGQPLRGGCFKGDSCRFPHPNDPEWEEASIPQSLTSKYASYRSHRPSSRSRSPRPSNRPHPHPHPRPRSPSPSPSRHRPASASTARMDSRAGASDGYRGSRSSVTSNSPAPPRHPPAFAAPPPLPPPPLPVPPSLPAAFSAPDAGAARKPSTREEMKVMWDRVLPIMADCVEARKVHQDALRNLQDFEKMLQTPRYTVLVKPEDKARVDHRLADLKAVCEEKARGVTTALNLLKETNWWPVGPNQDEGAAEKYRELIQYAGQLNITASDMYQAYMKKSLAAPASDLVPEPAVNIDPRDSTSRPLKRRRVSDAAEEPPALDPADVIELEKLQDTVAGLDDRISNIHSDLIALQNQNEEDIEDIIDKKLESLSLEPRGHPDSSELEQVDLRVKKNTQYLDELSKEVVVLMSDSAELQAQTERLKQEEDADRAEIEAMRVQFQAYEDASKKDRDAMEALSAALEAYRDQPPAPASVPLDFLIQSIDDPIRDAVRSVVRPMVEEMGQDLQQKMLSQDKQLYTEIWGKIALTLKVVDAVSKVTSPGPVS